MKGLLAALPAAALLLVGAPPAWAALNGEGVTGETNDKVVTFLSLGVLLFFVLVIVVGSVLQHKLDQRKDARKAARARQRVGW